MQTIEALEKRLEILERVVAELKGQASTAPPHDNWIARITGSFKDEPAFEEVIALGQELRAADRPPRDDGR